MQALTTYSTPLDCTVTSSSASQIDRIWSPLTGQYGPSWCQGVTAEVPGSFTNNWS